jgi:uncharacterized protein
MNRKRKMDVESTQRWRQRHAPRYLVLLALALAGSSCTNDSSSRQGTPGQDKADTADQDNDIAISAMEILPERPGLFDVARNPDGQWSTRLIGPSGDVFLASEAVLNKISALNHVLSVEENGVLLERYQVTPISDNRCTFQLRAANNQVIANGPVFGTCEEASAAVEVARDLIAGVIQFKAAVSQGARFVLQKDPADKKWRFAMRAADGRSLLESQAYSTRTAAVTGLESVRKNGKLTAQYRIDADTNGSISIRLVAGNGQEIATGGPFATEAEAAAVVTETVDLLRSEQVGNPW